MSLGSVSLVLAGVLAFHPFATSTLVGSTEPEPDPSWNEPTEEVPAEPVEGEPAEPVEGEPAEPVEGAPTEAGDPAEALAPVPAPEEFPVAAPAPTVVTRPSPGKGTGLLIGASVTGGLAWITALARVLTVNKCVDAVESGSIAASGTQCIFRTGPALILLTPAGWALNATTYGLAAGAGAARGKYDGVAAAWDGAPQRSTGAFIGSGAALLGVGVIGRVVTWFTFDDSVAKCAGGAQACGTALRLHFVGAQLSSASIAAGAGLLAFGVAYKKHRDEQTDNRKNAGLADLRLAPQIGLDYSGLSLTGRF